MTYRVNITVYKGATETSFTIGSVTAKNGLTATVGSTYVDFSVNTTTRITTASNVITIPVIVNGVTYNKVFSWSVSAQGVGQNAKVCQIISDSQLFTSTDGITYTPSTITLTPLFQYCAFSKWQYEINGTRTDVVSGQNGLTVDSDNKLIISNTTSLLSNRQSVTFVLLSGDSNAYDVLTVAKISNGLKGEDGADGTDGVDGLTVLLTNEAQSFTTDYTGRVLTTQTYTTDILVYKGANAYSFTNGLTTTTTNGITIKKTSNDTVSISVSAGTTIPTNNGSFTIPIVVDGVTYNKVLNWSLNKIGEKGETGASGTSAKVCKIVADNQVFISTDKITYTPTTITLKPSLQNVTFSKWQYVLNGETKDVVSGQQGLTIDSSNNLIISNTTSLLDISSTAIFKLISSDSNAYDTFTIAKISDGIDGKDGIDGINGEDGVSNYFFIRYSEYPNGTGMTETPTVNTKYMGTATSTVNQAPTSATSYKWTLVRGADGVNGQNGINGVDGSSSYLHIKYSNDGLTFTENNGEELGTWIGTYVDTNPTDSTNFADYNWVRFVGKDGANAKYVVVTGEQTFRYEENFKTLIEPQSITLSAIRYNITETGKWQYRASNGEWTDLGSTESQYVVTPKTGTFANNGKSLNVRYIADTYYDIITIIKVSNGHNGTDGVDGIDGVNSYFYIRYSDNPTGVGMTELPNENSKYLGTCSTTSSVAPSSHTEYKWSLIKGTDGVDGTTIVNIREQYYLSTSQQTLINGEWLDNAPTWTSGKFIWTRTVFSYNNNTETTTDPICVTGKDGADGLNGGVSVSGVDVFYYQSTSPTQLTGGTWQTTAPIWTNGRYVWTKTVTYLDNGNSHESKPICVTGEKGQNGSDGIQGEKGEDGRTSYLHIKYSDDGKTFTSNNGETVGKWIGTYVDFNEKDSTNFNDYTWKKYVGEDGTDGIDGIYERLKLSDPEIAASIDCHNAKRVIRALEVYETTGITMTEWNSRSTENANVKDCLIIGLGFENRELLYERIDKRVDIMMQTGLLEEARSLFDDGLFATKTASQAIAYKEFLPYFEGIDTLENCIETLKRNSRRYAKRQLTWFRRNENIKWINRDDKSSEDVLNIAFIEAERFLSEVK